MRTGGGGCFEIQIGDQITFTQQFGVNCFKRVNQTVFQKIVRGETIKP